MARYSHWPSGCQTPTSPNPGLRASGWPQTRRRLVSLTARGHLQIRVGAFGVWAPHWQACEFAASTGRRVLPVWDSESEHPAAAPSPLLSATVPATEAAACAGFKLALPLAWHSHSGSWQWQRGAPCAPGTLYWRAAAASACAASNAAWYSTECGGRSCHVHRLVRRPPTVHTTTTALSPSGA